MIIIPVMFIATTRGRLNYINFMGKDTRQLSTWSEAPTEEPEHRDECFYEVASHRDLFLVPSAPQTFCFS